MTSALSASTKSSPVFEPLNIHIGISASALFDMRTADKIFREKGEEAFMRHMNRKVDEPLKSGAALSFVKKMLALHNTGNIHVQVPILSRMNAFAQERIHNSVVAHGLSHMVNGAHDSPGAVYTQGRPISPNYLHAQKIDLFLTTNEADARSALREGLAAAIVPKSRHSSNATRDEAKGTIVLGYDYCRVLAVSYGLHDDSFTDDSEAFFKASLAQSGDMNEALRRYRDREQILKNNPSDPGPWAGLYIKMCAARDRLKYAASHNASHGPKIENRIITARDLATFARVAPTLKTWGAEPDQIISCGMTSKANYVSDVDLFADDSLRNIEATTNRTLAAYVPWNENPPRNLFAPAFKDASAIYKKQKKVMSAALKPAHNQTKVFRRQSTNLASAKSLDLNDFYFSDPALMPIDYKLAQLWVQAARALGQKFSKDPSTKVGVLVITPQNELVAVGVNNFPEGVAMTDERLNDRTLKYPLVSHGEESAIDAIARLKGTSTNGNIVVLTGHPCHDCSTHIANTGMHAIVGLEKPEPSSLMLKWADSMKTFSEITLREAGISVFPVIVESNNSVGEIDILGELENRGINLRTGHAFCPPIPLTTLLRPTALAACVAA